MSEEKKGFNFVKMEETVLERWKNIDLRSKIIEKNKNGTPFYFLQGPPYTSGRLHMGHAWNNSLKDFVLRFKKMKGFDVWDRAGYDMHGLPTARKVQAKFNLDSKEDIEKFGLDRFADECKKFSEEKSEIMNKDLKRVGIDMDFKDPYMPIENDYIEGVWWLIKQADLKGRLYEGLRTTSWCPSCQTALAKHEQDYIELKDNSIYVKFQSKNKPNEYLVIWTTTPWTIPYNLAVMVHPELDYSRVKIKNDSSKKNEVWIICNSRLKELEKVTDLEFEIIETFKGKKLEGYKYEHFWSKDIEKHNEIKKNSPKTHTVLLSAKYVTDSDGSGLVHCAPGCGPEDYEVGHENNIPPFNELDESGKFKSSMGKFSGLRSKYDDKKFIEMMEEENALVASISFKHDYAHCERCKSPITFRTTKQWFFKVEDLKEKMLEINSQVHWVPEKAKNAFDSWLENLRDNSITKQRFWGTPIPLWKCDKCGEYHVASGRKELEELGAKVPENLHRPYIDEVTFKCPKCNRGNMKRIPDVLDVWIDSGSASWNSLYFPKRKDLFEKYFPADFILEAKEQVRGWFNLLMISSILGFEAKSFKSVYVHGMLTDVEGVKMSKSLGNVISPYELIDKYGADTLRTYMSETNAGEDVSFSWDEVLLRFKNFQILMNVTNFLIDTSKDLNIKPKEIESAKMIESQYMLHSLNKTIKDVTRNFENYNLDKVAKPMYELFLELSRTYIQLIRDKATFGSKEEKQEILDVIYTVLLNNMKIFAPVAPFISDEVYLRLSKELDSNLKESVHLESWPKFNDNLISETLEKDFKEMEKIVAAILAARNEAKLGVRWPISKAIIDTSGNEEQKILVKDTLDNFSEIIKFQTNVKNIEIGTLDFSIKLDLEYGKIGKKFGRDSGKIIPLVKKNLKNIENHFNKTNETYKLDFKDDKDNKKIAELTLDLFKVERSVKEGYAFSDLKPGFVFIETELDNSLKSEGFARELSRRIQSERKKQGLVKSDTVNVFIATDSELKESILKNLKDQKEKIGSKKIELCESLNVKPFKIRENKFYLDVEKC